MTTTTYFVSSEEYPIKLDMPIGKQKAIDIIKIAMQNNGTFRDSAIKICTDIANVFNSDLNTTLAFVRDFDWLFTITTISIGYNVSLITNSREE